MQDFIVLKDFLLQLTNLSKYIKHSDFKSYLTSVHAGKF